MNHQTPPSKLYAMMDQKCPRCRRGELFTHKAYQLNHMLDMPKNCPHCGQPYEIEPGFYWGAMYITYTIVVGMFLCGLIIYFIFKPSVLAFTIVYVALDIILIPIITRYSRAILLYIFGSIKFDLKAFQSKAGTFNYSELYK